MTLFFPSAQITIYRRRRISGTDRFNISATFTAYPADIQPASRERMEMFEGRFGALFVAFVDVDVPIKESDQVVRIEDGKRFSVRGIQQWQGAGLLDYQEVILVAQDAN